MRDILPWLTFFISFVKAELCNINGKTVIYDCQDIKNQTDCRNQKSGLECNWSEDRCTYLKCEDLTPDKCFGQNIFGANCLLDPYKRCKSVTHCGQIVTTKQCTQIGFQKCIWDTKYYTCRPLACSDITNSTQCMSMSINGNQCSWYNNLQDESRCQVSQCALKNLYKCDGYQAGLNYCVIDNYHCRNQVCQDYKSTTSVACIDPTVYPKISETTYCASLPMRNGEGSICTAVDQCQDINDTFICEDITLMNQKKCKWDQTQKLCRVQECTDFDEQNCPESSNFQKCFVRNGVCKSCQSLADPCQCIGDPLCQLSYNTNFKAYVCSAAPVIQESSYESSVEDMKWELFQFSGSSRLIVAGILIFMML